MICHIFLWWIHQLSNPTEASMLTPELLISVNLRALVFASEHLKSEDLCVNVNIGYLKTLRVTIQMVMVPALNTPWFQLYFRGVRRRKSLGPIVPTGSSWDS